MPFTADTLRPQKMARLRITYRKLDPLRFTSVLDMQKLWERVFRRSALPLAYTQGFHPSPKMHLGAALPLGFLSNEELMDVWIIQDIPLDEVTKRLASAIHPGIEILAISYVDNSVSFLQKSVHQSDYLVTSLLKIDFDDLELRIKNFLKHTSFSWKRKNKDFNIRSQVLALSLKKNKEIPCICMQLTASESNTGRPDEVMEALGYDRSDFEYLRKKIYLLD
jgi:radical SAM-linked protein